MFPLANMLHLFPHKFARLGRWRLSFTRIFPGVPALWVAVRVGALAIGQYAAAGVRTYFERRDTRVFIDRGAAFAKVEDWAAAPGGAGVRTRSCRRPSRRPPR